MRIFIINIAFCSRRTLKTVLPDGPRSGFPYADSTPLFCCAAPVSGRGSLMNGTTMDIPQARKRACKVKGSVVPLAYRLAVTSRVVAALLGGYLLASLTSVCITQWVPMARADAVITGMLLSFVAYLLAVIWCFACRTAWRAWAGILLPAAVLALVFAAGRWLS
jgi:hypothetical protein